MFRAKKSEQYALRALLELAKHEGEGPKKISEIAEAQAIPLRFLEVILGQLKGSGFVDSKRGYHGGYYLLQPPEKITVGDVLRFLHGDEDPVHNISCMSKKECPFECDCAFVPMWKKVSRAIFEIYDETTFADLIKHEKGSNSLLA
jgi:Rrf2 family cysteine metabolism transcriptional repressor